jgi:hypothetical protein
MERPSCQQRGRRLATAEAFPLLPARALRLAEQEWARVSVAACHKQYTTPPSGSSLLFAVPILWNSLYPLDISVQFVIKLQFAEKVHATLSTPRVFTHISSTCS